MRRAPVAALVLTLAAGTAAAQAQGQAPSGPDISVKPAKPGWLSSKRPVQEKKTWTPPGQWPMCVAALTPPGEDAARAAALANYRALYFQHAVVEQGEEIEAAKARLAATAKPPAFIAAECVKDAPSAADRAFRAEHPWARSYFDGPLDREMFSPVPMTE